MNRDPQQMTSAELLRHLREIARDDADEFERCRRLLIDRTIESFPPEHRRRGYGLQFRLDLELGRYRDPLARMNRMVEIFWDGVHRFREVLDDPQRYAADQTPPNPGKVIPLPHRKTRH